MGRIKGKKATDRFSGQEVKERLSIAKKNWYEKSKERILSDAKEKYALTKKPPKVRILLSEEQKKEREKRYQKASREWALENKEKRKISQDRYNLKVKLRKLSKI